MSSLKTVTKSHTLAEVEQAAMRELVKAARRPW